MKNKFVNLGGLYKITYSSLYYIYIIIISLYYHIGSHAYAYAFKYLYLKEFFCTSGKKMDLML